MWKQILSVSRSAESTTDAISIALYSVSHALKGWSFSVIYFKLLNPPRHDGTPSYFAVDHFFNYLLNNKIVPQFFISRDSVYNMNTYNKNIRNYWYIITKSTINKQVVRIKASLKPVEWQEIVPQAAENLSMSMKIGTQGFSRSLITNFG